MFKTLDLKATYSSYENEIGNEFYIPVLNTAVKYDRATAFFSSKSLSNYAKGLEVFAKKGNYFRLIVSEEISDEDFYQIKSGYGLRKEITDMMVAKLRENLSLEEEKNISNLAFLISIGIVDIKIAFTKMGIFHDKFGVVEDEIGDIICYRGSNNETNYAYNYNYESFDITCSWLASKFDLSKITKSKDTFSKLWNNELENVIVCNMEDKLTNSLLSYNRGKVIIEKSYLQNDCFILDYDKKLFLIVKNDIDIILKSTNYKLKIKRYVDIEKSNDTKIVFKDTISYIDYKKIISILKDESVKKKYCFITTERLIKYISDKEMNLDKRLSIGLDIKNKNSNILDVFLKYKLIVNKEFDRKLREKQMWDSFYMFSMKKSSNFSVPGSGKTAAVLGVYAYLQSKGILKRIMVVGPKSSFSSWCDEFSISFGNKKKLSIFNIQNYNTCLEKKYAITFCSGASNLLLFNYESIGQLVPEIKKIIENDTLLVFDEVHKIKAIDGIRAKQALDISKDAKYIIALTGTPIPNSYLDIYNLLKILYHSEYNEFFNFTINQLKNPTENDIKVINDRLQPFFCRTTKKELGVPTANDDIIIRIMSNEKENKIFNILLKKYYKNKLVFFIRLLQLESNPKLLLEKIDISEFSDVLNVTDNEDKIDYVNYSREVSKLISEIDNTEKFTECVNLAVKLLNSGKKIIIWCIFKDTMKRFLLSLEKKGINAGIVYGDIDMSQRNDTINGFRQGRINCLITNPHTLAESVSLHSICHDAIYFEYSYNLVHLLQSKDRIHRLGLKKDQYTQYYFLQDHFKKDDGKDFSLDEKIYLRLQEKEYTMLEAIENRILENGNTSYEDLEIIFNGLNI